MAVYGIMVILYHYLLLGKLEVGKEMTTKVQLCPPPKPFIRTKEFEVVNRDLSTNLMVKVPVPYYPTIRLPVG